MASEEIFIQKNLLKLSKNSQSIAFEPMWHLNRYPPLPPSSAWWQIHSSTARNTGLPLPLRAPLRATGSSWERQPPEFPTSPSHVLQRLNSKQVRPRGEELPSFTCQHNLNKPFRISKRKKESFIRAQVRTAAQETLLTEKKVFWGPLAGSVSGVCNSWSPGLWIGAPRWVQKLLS